MSDETPRDNEKDKTPRKATPLQRQAGIANLMKFNAERRAGAKAPNFRHGLAAFIKSGAAPSASIEQQLDRFEDGLIADLGGKPSTGELCLIQSCRTCLGVLLLAEQHVHQGVGRFSKNRWIWQVSATYGNTLRLNLRELGLGMDDWRGKAADLASELEQKRVKSSLSACVAATEEPTTLPEWYTKHTAQSADSGDGLIEGLPVNKTEVSEQTA